MATPTEQTFKLLVGFFALLILASCQTAADIDRALYAAAETVSERDRVTGQRTLNLTRRPEQIRQADARIEEGIAKYRSQGIALNGNVDADAYSRLTRILKRIHAVSHFAGEDWKILLLPDDRFNAFVNGGTYVVVNKGLLREAQNDDEIAAIIGHEMGHVAANHIFEKQAYGIAIGLAGSHSAKRAGYGEAFTLIQEQEADRIGILYAALAGYEPFAASRIWNRLAQKRDDRWFAYKDHPASSDRARETQEVAKAVNQYRLPGMTNPNHKQILACNVLWCISKEKLAAGAGGGLVSTLSAGLDAYLKHQKAKLERGRQEAEITRERAGVASQLRYGTYQRSLSRQARFGNIPGPLIEAVYHGQVSNHRTNLTLPTALAFTRTAANHVEGRYIYQYNQRRIEGTVVVVAAAPGNALLFEWTLPSARGWAKLQFAPDGGSFTGIWGYRGSTAISGEWRGRVSP